MEEGCELWYCFLGVVNGEDGWMTETYLAWVVVEIDCRGVAVGGY